MNSVNITYEILPQSALPQYHLDRSFGDVWYLENLIPKRKNGKFPGRFTFSTENEVSAHSQQEVTEKFEKALIHLVSTADHGGVIQVFVRTDSILAVEFKFILQFGAFLVGEVRSETDMLYYTGLSMKNAPRSIHAGLKEEQFLNDLCVNHIMES